MHLIRFILRLLATLYIPSQHCYGIKATFYMCWMGAHLIGYLFLCEWFAVYTGMDKYWWDDSSFPIPGGWFLFIGSAMSAMFLIMGWEDITRTVHYLFIGGGIKRWCIRQLNSVRKRCIEFYSFINNTWEETK